MLRFSVETVIILLQNTSSRISPKFLSCDISNCFILINLNPLFDSLTICTNTPILHMAYNLEARDQFSVSCHSIIIFWSGGSISIDMARTGLVDAAGFEIKEKKFSYKCRRKEGNLKCCPTTVSKSGCINYIRWGGNIILKLYAVHDVTAKHILFVVCIYWIFLTH